MHGSKPSFRSKWLLALGGAVISLATAECVLRWVVPIAEIRPSDFLGTLGDERLYDSDSSLFWKLRPGSEAGLYRINEVGLRVGGRPVSEVAKHRFRIVCLGDSCTFGGNVRLEQAYGMVLEETLRQAAGGNVETTLLAVPGYSSFQSRRLLAQRWEVVRPDVLVVYVGAWNDHAAALGESDQQRAATHGSPFRIVNATRSLFRPSVNSEAIHEAFARGEVLHGSRVSVAEFTANIEAIAERAQAADCVLVLVLPPLPEATERKYPGLLQYRDALLKVAGRGNCLLLDAPAHFEQLAREIAEGRPFDHVTALQNHLFGDWVHPSVLGHQLLGRELAKMLRESCAAQLRDSRHPPRVEIVLEEVTLHAGDAFEPVRLELVGKGIGEADLQRVIVGNRVARTWSTSADNLGLGFDFLIPGAHDLWFQSSDGAMGVPQRVIRLANPLEAEVRGQDRGELFLRVSGRPGDRVSVWISNATTSEPTSTSYGPFWLAHGMDQNSAGFCFEALRLPVGYGRVTDQGSAEIVISLGDRAAELSRVYAQALVKSPESESLGALTQLTAIENPR